MKIVKQLTKLRHGGIVFINSSAAMRKDMTLAIAIMSEDQTELAILESEALEVMKLKALLSAGFMPSFQKLESGNYYVCQKCEVSSVTDGINEANVSADLPNNSVTDPAPVKTKRPVVYKNKVVGLYNEETDELEIYEEYHKEDHDYLLLEPNDENPYWEIDEDLEQIMSLNKQPVKEPERQIKECFFSDSDDIVLATSKFLNY
ncbi:TPA: hypothetical protein RQN22_001823 [Aeromonas dhakensis]|nr:hypothetical protein [Aeromonas dhakensis]